MQAAKQEAGRLEKECQQILCIISTLKNHVTDVDHQIDEAIREVSYSSLTIHSTVELDSNGNQIY